jgi:predicted exporter
VQRLLDGAVATLPIRGEQLGRFVDDLESARTAPLITRADLEATSLRSAVELLLVEHDGRWNALMPLAAPRAGGAVDTERISEALTRRTAATGRAAGPFELRVLDLKTESDALYAGYLAEASRLSLIGLVAIMVLLAVALRSMRAMLRVVMPLLVSVMIVMAGFSLAGHPMNILHLVGLLLIVAIGSNYALFFERETQRGEPPIEARTVASLVVANLTTVIGFGVLALSSVPVLAAIGSTVAPGAFLALVLSALMSGGRMGGIPR